MSKSDHYICKLELKKELSNQNRKQQRSKLARANIKLSRMIEKYYSLNFDLVAIRKEITQ